jgi:hypothetical protein
MVKLLKCARRITRSTARTLWKTSAPVTNIESTPFHSHFKTRAAAKTVDSRAYVCAEKKYVYFRIPKAANSFIFANLIFLEKGVRLSLSEADKQKNKGISLSSLSASEIETIMSDYYKFTFVRNPYTRVLSAYLDKIARKKKQSQIVYSALNKSPESIISFEEFLDFLTSRECLYSDPHWIPQSDLIPFANCELNHIGRLENIEEDLCVVTRYLFGTSDIIPLAISHATGANAAATDLLNLNNVKLIYSIYNRDFERFGYDVDPKASPNHSGVSKC